MALFLYKGGDRLEKYEQAEKDYKNGMKYKDIASKYGVSLNTVKSWKLRYWASDGSHTVARKVCTRKKKVAHLMEDATKKTLENDNLTDEQQMFCLNYIKTFNATQSYINAYHCTYNSALCAGPRLLGNVRIREEIQRLKEIKRQQITCSADDLVEMNMRIAFGDLGNYLTFGQEEIELSIDGMPMLDEDGKKKKIKVNRVNLNESVNVDTQIIQEIKQGKDGVSIKLADKNKAIDWLTKYFLLNPMDKHKQEFDKHKLEIELLKIETNVKENESCDNEMHDNFLVALNASAGEVWSDDK